MNREEVLLFSKMLEYYDSRKAVEVTQEGQRIIRKLSRNMISMSRRVKISSILIRNEIQKGR